MADRLSSILLALVAVTLCPSLAAQTALSDPTKPPAALNAGDPLVSEVGGPVLQSVILPKKGRGIAVIGGQQVKLGERYGESRLIKLSEKEAVLEGPAGVEHLLLTPGIEKINITPKKTTKKTNKTPAKTYPQGGSKP